MKNVALLSLLAIGSLIFFCSDDNGVKLKTVPENLITISNAFPNLTFSRPLDFKVLTMVPIAFLLSNKVG